MVKYTQTQIDTAFGILSGRIDPEEDLKTLDAANHLLWDGELKSSFSGGGGNVSANAHRMKAEYILKQLLQNAALSVSL